MNRRGFSLIEVMIAIVILTAGVLALAATSGAVTKMIGQSGRLSESASVAEGRLEILRATPCASLSGGNSAEAPYTFSWTVTTSGANGFLRTVVLTISYPNGRTTRTDVYTTTISCAV